MDRMCIEIHKFETTPNVLLLSTSDGNIVWTFSLLNYNNIIIRRKISNQQENIAYLGLDMAYLDVGN